MEERWLVYRALKMGRVRREITDDEGGRKSVKQADKNAESQGTVDEGLRAAGDLNYRLILKA